MSSLQWRKQRVQEMSRQWKNPLFCLPRSWRFESLDPTTGEVVRILPFPFIYLFLKETLSNTSWPKSSIRPKIEYDLFKITFLNVYRKLLKDDRIIERSHIPKQLFKEISGTSVFQEQNDRVYPLLDFPENGINDLSSKLIKGHNDQLKHAKIRMQVDCQ